MKLFLVAYSYIEGTEIFGIFDKNNLDNKLNELAETHVGVAENEKTNILNWYKNVHLPFRENECVWGCEHIPYALTASILEFSKSRFTVTELKLNNIAKEGVWV